MLVTINLASTQKSQKQDQCPAGTRYDKVKMGGLFNRRTIFEGCGSSSEIAYWWNQAHPDSQRRWNNFGRALQKAGDDYNRQVQLDMRAQQNRQRNCTTTFVGSTAYTNCYWCCKSGSLMPYHSGLKAIQNPQGKSRRNDSAIFNRCMHLIKLSVNTYRLFHASVLSWSPETIAL